MSGIGSTVRALTCPACGGTIALRAAGSSVSLVCEHCGTTLDATDPEVKIIARAAAAMTVPEIALGTRGSLDGEQWEVVGYLERTADGDRWSEYLLFNPYLGYAFLLDDGDRFSLGRLLDRAPGSSFGDLTYDGQVYRRFGWRYGTWVRFVVGEFYWRVAVGDHVLVSDYVRPGSMLSHEENGDERSWTMLKLLDRGVAERAFGIDRRSGTWATPAPHAPSPYYDRLMEALIIGTVAIMTLLLIALFGGRTEKIAASSFDTVIDAPMASNVIKGITLTGKAGNAITIDARTATLNNSWIDVDLSLVNTDSDQSFDGYVLLEQYHGVDGDGPWSEGNRSSRTTFSNVPPGRYELVVDLTGYRWIGPNQSYEALPVQGEVQSVDITMYSGGVFAWNLILALLAILLWPGILLWLHLRFEKARLAPVTT